MANGKFTLGKQSGGTLGLVFPDGVGDTEVVLPESGELATKEYADTKIDIATANSYDLGVGQAWQNVTGSRALNTTYTNTTGKPIVVNVIVSGANDKDVSLYVNEIFINSQAQHYAGSGIVNGSIVVPNEATYKATNTYGALALWAELR